MNRLKISRPALCYHSVTEKVPFKKNLHSISPWAFEQQLLRLKREGYQFISIDEFLEARKKGKGKIIAVTFDDGYRDVLTYASPILEANDIPFTLFLTTSLLNGELFWRDGVRFIIDNDQVMEFKSFLQNSDSDLVNAIDFYRFYNSTKQNHINSLVLANYIKEFLGAKGNYYKDRIYFDFSDVIELPKSLCTVGNHTHSHYRLSSIGEEEQERELKKAISVLNTLGLPLSSTFAIPFGENSSFNQTTIELIRGMGFTGFVMTNQEQYGQMEPNIHVDSLGLLYSNRILPDEHFPLA